MKKLYKRLMSILLIFTMLVSMVVPAANSQADSHREKKGLYEGDGYQVQFDVTETWEDQYELLGMRAFVNEKDYSVSYQVTEDWGSGFIGTIVIKNTSNHVIEDWGIDFYFDNSIQNIWNALIASQEGRQYKIRNAGYNQNIGAGESVEFGFQAAGGNSENLVGDMRVTNISFEENTSGTGGSESGGDDKEGTGKDDSEKEDTGTGGAGTEKPGGDQTGEILTISEKGLTLTESGYILNEDFTTFTGSLKRAGEVKDFDFGALDLHGYWNRGDDQSNKTIYRNF